MQVSDNNYQFVNNPVVVALRERAPQIGRDGWYSELSDAIGYSEAAIKNWYYGKSRPEPEAEEALTRHFGIQFADQVCMARYGWHVTENGQQAKENLKDIAEHAANIIQLTSGKSTKIPLKGGVS